MTEPKNEPKNEPQNEPQNEPRNEPRNATDPIDATATSAWAHLARLRETLPSLPALLDTEPERFADCLVEAPFMRLDLSRQRWNAQVRTALVDLWEECGLEPCPRALPSANAFNPTEGRAVLHTALRAGDDAVVMLDGVDVAAEARAARRRMAELVEAVRSGDWTGQSGRSIRDVVNIGIGGSFLGPALVCDALGTPDGPAVHFLANVDGEEAARVLAGLDPMRTLFVIASKSFGTLETRVNADTARSWFLERGGRPDTIAQHFVAVSTNVEAAAEFGLPERNLLPMWDWVGGRYSLWSPIGLPIALGFGMARFEALLAGARAMDEHFASAEPMANAPLQLALAELWNQAFIGTGSLAVLPYASALAKLPDYLQQLEMESNGKRVRRDGSPVTLDTGTIVWGNVGTNGQHAYHQLLHQGTQQFSAEFILPLRVDHRFAHHHEWLVAHCFAQAEVLARGRARGAVEEELVAGGMDPAQARAAAPHRAMPGNHPSTTVLLDDLDAKSLGALIALHEHKVFAAGMLCGINSFDQWGVEFGKMLGDRIHGALVSDDDAGPESDRISDPTSRALVRLFREQRSGDC